METLGEGEVGGRDEGFSSRGNEIDEETEGREY